MFRLHNPEYLYLLMLLPLTAGLYWYTFRERSKALSRFGDLSLIEKLARTRSPGRQVFKAVLSMTALTLLLVGLARPQFGTRVETLQREGQDVFVALDVSLSMLAQDIRPNRLEKAKLELSGLIDRLQGDRIGLIAFAGDAFVQCPLTLDHGAAKLFLSAIGPDLIPTPGTALGQAIRKATESFEDSETRGKVLVLLTDGEDHEGDVTRLAEVAAEEGIVIHTIGIGTAKGVPIPLVNDSGRYEGFKKGERGDVVLTRLDDSTLKTIAEVSGGQYYAVSEHGGELDDLYDTIAGMENTELDAREVTLFDEKFQIVVGLALALLLIEFLFSESRKRLKIWKGRFQ